VSAGATTAPLAPEPTGIVGQRTRLVLLSFLMLFLELALIRWAGSNVVSLSYFSNFILLGSFLGIGLGFLRARQARNFFPWAPVALVALVGFIAAFPVELRTSGAQLLFFGGRVTESGPPREVVLTVIFVLVATVMACIGEGVARTFKRFEALEAYKLDLIGSVLGILAFIALSFLGAPPLAWGSIVVAVFVVVYLPFPNRRLALLQGAALAGLVLILGLESFAANTYWSPYYKIETHTDHSPATPDDPGYDRLAIDVNGAPHQVHAKASKNPLYNLVYDRAKPRTLDDVLVIGAGGGNDVSIALAQGAKRVDAVEIDPKLYELGQSEHPDQVYSDPRVHKHIDDGRAFLERTDRKYDLVLFALPDSLTLVQGQSALRLESYLFTTEAIEAARDRLKPGGVFSMYNYYRHEWLVDRYANTLQQAFDEPPCVVSIGPPSIGRIAVMVDSRAPESVTCQSNEVWGRQASAPAPATDDHPFPYLRDRNLPTFYIVTIALIALISLLAIRGVGGPIRPMLRFTDLFFMGAAFLLLETKSVVQFALLFGTTWFVNALVFLGVLLSVLAAVALSRRVTFKRPARLYVLLLAALLLAWIVPPHLLLELGGVPRFFVAATLAFFPIFTANVVFTQRFKDTGDSTAAFGANLLGAMFGGLLEYSALIVGYRALLLVAAILYGLAFLFGRAHLGGASESVPARVPEPVGVR
jgi:SAM-dependent methyltransferase